MEGFYGTPWTQDKRLATFDFMARVGMNTYVYAPKDDPYQRADWRALYPESELSRFRDLLARATADGVNFVYSISPGLDIRYSGQADRQALAAKVDQLAGLGIHTVMLSLDDIPEKLDPADTTAYQGNLAHAQAALANWLYATQRGKDAAFVLWLTPTHYSGTKADPYLITLGSKLERAVPLVWTGPMVLSGHITNAQADAFGATTGRKPLVWDNYPVNDYTYAIRKKPRLILGPLRNRDAGLADHVAGYLFNPMIQAEASQLPLYTGAAYLANPGAYDPERAWRQATEHLTTAGANASVLQEFASYAQSSVVQTQEAPLLASALNAYAQSGPTQGTAGGASAAADLAKQFSSMVSLPARLSSAVSAELYDEFKPWATVLYDKGQAGQLALQADEARARGDFAAAGPLLPQLEQSLTRLVSDQSTAMIAGTLVEDFLAQVIARVQTMGR